MVSLTSQKVKQATIKEETTLLILRLGKWSETQMQSKEL
jgi:hypothetical protein